MSAIAGAVEMIDRYLDGKGDETVPKELKPSLKFFRDLLIQYRAALQSGVPVRSCHGIRHVIVDSWPLRSNIAESLAQAEYLVEMAMFRGCGAQEINPGVLGGSKETEGGESEGEDK